MENHFNKECLYVYNKFGETIVQNICTYEDVKVSWGFMNWFNFIVVVIAISIVLNAISDTLAEVRK